MAYEIYLILYHAVIVQIKLLCMTHNHKYKGIHLRQKDQRARVYEVAIALQDKLWPQVLPQRNVLEVIYVCLAPGGL
jgi:hypothetical protein